MVEAHSNLPPAAPPALSAGAPFIVGLGGSNGSTSKTEILLRQCLGLLEVRGARTVAFNAAQLARLPIYGVGAAAAGTDDCQLVESVRRADAVVIATPGYHGSMSGLVKNALDHLEGLREDVRPYLQDRAVGVIVAAAGWQACGTTLVSVRSAVHALRGWPTPFGVTVNTVEQDVDDPRVSGALEVLAGQLVQFTSWQRIARAAAR